LGDGIARGINGCLLGRDIRRQSGCPWVWKFTKQWTSCMWMFSGLVMGTKCKMFIQYCLMLAGWGAASLGCTLHHESPRLLVAAPFRRIANVKLSGLHEIHGYTLELAVILPIWCALQSPGGVLLFAAGHVSHLSGTPHLFLRSRLGVDLG